MDVALITDTYTSYTLGKEFQQTVSFDHNLKPLISHIHPQRPSENPGQDMESSHIVKNYLPFGDFFDGVCFAVGEEWLTEFLVFIITVHLTQETMLLGAVQGSEDKQWLSLYSQLNIILL